jgi:hypothetical protein
MDDAQKLTDIRQRAEHSTDKWNVVWAQSDRAWLLKRVAELKAEVEVLQSQTTPLTIQPSVRKVPPCET